MFAPELYFPIFMHTMLGISVVAFLIYTKTNIKPEIVVGFNRTMIWPFAGLLSLYLGFRPISGVFVDMPTYASAYELANEMGVNLFTDWGFNLLMNICAQLMQAETFFFVCALIYIVPLVIGLRHIHDDWALAAFFVFVGALQFFSYGVNGIRNGLACSLLIAAFAFFDRKIVMVVLMVVAEGMHKSSLLPIAAFLIAGLYPNIGMYTALWFTSLTAVLIFREDLAAKAAQFFTFATGSDERLINYAEGAGMGGDKGGFRIDFILYSIVPIFLAWVFSNSHVREDKFFRRLICTYLASNSFWLLMMYAAQSNRFAYLSWFLMPWIIIYPFIPFKPDPSIDQLKNGRTELLPFALLTSFAFTYVMNMFIYG